MMIMMTTTAAYDYYDVGVGVSKENISLYRRAMHTSERSFSCFRKDKDGEGGGGARLAHLRKRRWKVPNKAHIHHSNWR